MKTTTHRLKLSFLGLLMAAAQLLPPLTAQADTRVQELLKRADARRAGSSHLEIHTLVQQLAADGSVSRERRYTVLSQGLEKSLVLMRSPAEQGQKVLMLGEDYWLFLPSSQRPVRITPSQKILGEASTGDIATLNWADDYDGELRGEAPCEEAAGPAVRSCLHLSLRAQRKGLSYQRIELWLGKARGEPVRAELYLLSDKLAKRARYQLDAQGMVSEMMLEDALAGERKTRVSYQGRRERRIPEAWLNPMFLSRSPVLE
ncbi:outer membrane lipoprotein-sorting protein [Roseateles sp.]|jgi:hypothetical protein|uniref:outer membrane lipoprotein-sorting protein n=1 Tax=Roseateles sp. TaxID=1971397 RepID=UPI00391DB082